MKLAHVSSLIPVFLLLAAPITQAQETTGQLQGRVLDPDDLPIPYVNVLVTGPALQGARGCLGAQNGSFIFLALPVGTYRLQISHVAYEGATIENVRIQLGQTTSLTDVQLRMKTLETETIVVVGKAPLLDLTSTEGGGVLNTRSYEALPFARDYRSIAVLLPQANTSFLGDETNYVGGTGLDNCYFIDGIDVTDPYLGITGTRLPYNFVEEVEVRTGGYEAEYRSSLGGIVNAVTYSGSNRMTGQAFGFFVNNRFTGDTRQSFADPSKGGFAYYDVGFGLGGPIKKDALWYYAAYNPTFAREEVEVSSHGLHDDETTTHSFAGKLTWRSSPRNTLVLTLLGDPTKRFAVGDPVLASVSVVALETLMAVWLVCV